VKINLDNLELDKNSPIPIYFQIENKIREKIDSGEYKEGYKLPSEQELVEKLNVSRPTIRHAMNNLVRDGLLKIKRGSGTFIKTKDFEEPVLGIRSYTREAMKKGYIPNTKILGFQIIEQDSELSKIFKSEEKVVKIRRLRYLNDEPTAIDVTYIPIKFVPNISKQDFKESGENQSLYNLLKTKYHLILSHGEETIDATIVDNDESKLLLMNTDEPINLRRRVLYTKDDEPLLYMKSIYKTRYKVKLEGPY